ncbi:MAG TPA: SAM-dependent methyltransferase [Rubrivivax sp.]
MREIEPDSVSAALAEHIRSRIADAGGWVPFDRFMDWALYTPGLGYYAAGDRQFGLMPASGSDFVTAPELSPLFGRALAVQVRQGLDAAASADVWEFGAGSGALAEQLLRALGERVGRYTIVDVSGALRARQQSRLAAFGDRVAWVDRLPEPMYGVVIGNEVLDAMAARLLAFDGLHWHERGVALHEGRFVFADSTDVADPPPPFETPCAPGTVTELHPQAEAFIATLAGRLQRGLALFIDYGFPQGEYYHPQRSAGTLMCHRGHRADGDPLADVGLKDMTVHLNFSGIALAAQDAGMDVLGYTSQARFLLNCGLLSLMQDASVAQAVTAHKLVAEHEMGELFKVIAFGRGIEVGAAGLTGFTTGDRSHRL